MQKHILITGSTDGIGKLAATRLAAKGHRLYLHGRDAAKLNEVCQTIRAATGNQAIDGFVGDFSDLAAVHNMADEIRSKLPQLDVLINNAGILLSPNETTASGLDVRFAVNYFAPYLLTKALQTTLAQAASPRLLNLGSAAQAPVSLAALAGEESLAANVAYAQSKLALTMWSYHLAATQSDIAVLVVNPGSLLNTKMVQQAYGRHRAEADKGANILFDLALAAEYDGISGQYFDNDLGDARGAFGTPHADALDQQKIAALLTATEAVLARQRSKI